jgi:hypothetical protein
MMRSLVAIAAVVVLAGTIGTAVYAMVEDARGAPSAFDAKRQADETPGEDSGRSVAAVCVEEVPDCQDMIVDGGAAAGTCLEGTEYCVDTPGAGFQQCATEEPCGDFAPSCPPDTACTEPWLMDPPVCPGGVTVEECFPDGVPAGWDCVTLESFPVQVKCYPIACPIHAGPVTILPVPSDEPIVDEPQTDPAPATEEEIIPPIEPCIPGDCTEDVDGVVYCKPIDDPCLPQPDPNVRCLPPDCAVSSDGSVSCPVPLPEPCLPAEGEPAPGGGADDLLPTCETPPNSGGGCEEGDPSPARCLPTCPDRPELTPEECARLSPSSQGGGSDGSPGSEAVE